MAKLKVLSSKGVKKADMNLPGYHVEKENIQILNQAMRVYEDAMHLGLSRVKTRSEVSISKRKIYRQKGTGGARHGAASAPIFVGGGVAHGPKGVKRRLSLSKKLRAKAMKIALSLKAKEGKMIAIDSLGKLKKTKEAKDLLDKISKTVKSEAKIKKFGVLLSTANAKSKLYFQNIGNVTVGFFDNTNAYEILKSPIVVIDKEAFSEKTKKTENKINGKVTSTAKNAKTKKSTRGNKPKKKLETKKSK